MTLLIDSYDSFSYNLYQLVGELDPDIKVVRNDELTVAEIRALNTERIILSPGPGKVTYAKRLMHGKQSIAKLDLSCPIFKGCPERAPVARYHSLAADDGSLPEELEVTAVTEDGEVMAVQHKTLPVFGVQFHPESIMTPDGKMMLKNFIDFKV